MGAIRVLCQTVAGRRPNLLATVDSWRRLAALVRIGGRARLAAVLVCVAVLPLAKFGQIRGRDCALPAGDVHILADVVRQLTLLAIVGGVVAVVRGLSAGKIVRILVLHPSSPGWIDRRTLTWVLGPVAIGAALLVALLATGHSLSGSQWLDLLLATAIGEELLFRGLLPLLALDTVAEAHGFLVVSVAFMLWHLPDALLACPPRSVAIAIVGSFALTFAAAQAVLMPLRLVSRTILPSIVVHLVANAAALMLFG